MTDYTVWLFSNEGVSIGELSVAGGSLLSCTMSLEINGEHSMSIETDRMLTVGTRCITKDPPDGRWREWVIDEVEQEHSTTEYGTCSYHLTWSLQYDLQGTNEGTIRQPGMENDGTSASVALNNALRGSIWSRSEATPRTNTAVIMNYNSAWDRLDQVVKHWGGEIDDEIRVSNDGKVTYRGVKLIDHIGDTEAKRRLEWRHDLTSITRSPDPGPYYCRVIPTGNGESIDADDGESTISEPLTIDSIMGRQYLSDSEAERVFRVRAYGDYFYPTCVVNYSTDDEYELLTLAYEDLYNHTRPGISYTGTISQLIESGMDIGEGVNLGDEVQIVDYGFNKDYPLVTQERIVKIEWDMLRLEDKKVTIGKFTQNLERTMAGMASAVGLEKIAWLDDFNWVNVEVPELDPMVIDAAGDDFTIDPVEYDELDLSQYAADFDQRLSDLETVLSALTGIEYDPDTASWYDSDGNLLNNATTYANDPNSFVGNSYDSLGAKLGSGGDGWIHQINGVTQSTGTINFVTTGDSSSSSTAKPSATGKTTKTDRQEAQREHAAILRTTRQNKKNQKKEESPSTTTKKSYFQVTAANIAGSKGVDIYATKDNPKGLFAEENNDNFVFVDEWFKNLFGGGS